MATDVNPGPDLKHRGWRLSGNAVTGLLFIAVGVLFFIDRQGWMWGWDLSFSKLWPVLLIVLGVGQMLGASDESRADSDGRTERIRRGRRVSGLWWLFVGVIMLMHQNHWMSIHQSWPLFIIAGGISTLFGRDAGRRRER